MAVSVAVLGAGSWGTALAIQLARLGHSVRLWARDAYQAESMQAARTNERYLPGIELADNITVSADFDGCVEGVERVLVVTPSHAFAETIDRLAPLLTG
jgi:glycerol-3-phosphate dehydrogenase (NAD(P)+)